MMTWNKQQCALSILSTMALMTFVGLALATSVIPHQAAFIQTGDQLRYFMNADMPAEEGRVPAPAPLQPPSSDRSPNGSHRDEEVVGKPVPPDVEQLIFAPTQLNFGKQEHGRAAVQSVRVRNPSRHAVRLDAVSGTSHDFHASFFAHKTLDAGDETWFEVAFLPRTLGVIHSTLYINSSLGQTILPVSGEGRSSSYRLPTHLSARTCINGSMLSPITLYNPFDEPLHITQMYTSSALLHLELPSSPSRMHTDGDTLWRVAPHSSATVMHGRYMGAVEQNTTAYIRVKTERGGIIEQLLIPLDAHVSRRKGIYAVTQEIDLGIVRNDETSTNVGLWIASNTNKSVEIISVYEETHEQAVRITNPPNVDEGNGKWKATLDGRCASCPVLVARIAFLGGVPDNQDLRSRHYSGRIIVEGRQKGGVKYKLVIPYKCSWFAGELLHEAAETSFHAHKEPPIVRNVTLTSSFDLPVAIHNVSLSKMARRYFTMVPVVELPLLLLPHVQPVVAFALRYHSRGPAQFVGTCRLQSNMSAFDIAIHIFDGRLQMTLSSLEQSAFDFGMVEAGDTRSILLTVANPNTVPIAIRQHRHAVQAFTTMSIIGTHMFNDSVHQAHTSHPWSSQMRILHNIVDRNALASTQDGGATSNEWIAGQDVIIAASSVTVFEYTLVAPSDATFSAHGALHTFHTPYEQRSFAVRFEVRHGTMVSIPTKIVLHNAYPYRVAIAPLHVYSTFERDMPLLRLTTLTHDPRFVFETFEQQKDLIRRNHIGALDDMMTPIVVPNTMSYLGRVFFVPHRACKEDCYVGTSLEHEEGKWFAYGMRLPANLAQIDYYVFNKMRQRWRRLTESDDTHSNEYVVRTHVVVDTDAVKNVRIPLEARLVWPRIMTRHTVHFPLTAVGNFSILNLTMHNPSSRPVLVQLLPLTIYPDPELFLHYFDEHLPSVMSANVEMNETLMFTLRDTELFPLRDDSPVPRLREEIEAVVNHQMPRFTLSMILKPGMKVRVRVGFMPRDFQMRSSLIIIRNNLTGIEPVVLHGRGANVEMLMARHPSRHDSPIIFDLTSMSCASASVTVKRSMPVWNSGQLPLHITNISINGHPCVNRGYRILNCEPFKLRPNDTHHLSVAYTPDYLATVGEASIQLYAAHNSTPWTYYVAAVLPSSPSCHDRLPRPHWEALLYYMTLCCMGFMLVCVWASAFLEGDRYIACAYKHMHEMFREETRDFVPFDLNAYASSAVASISARASADVRQPTTATTVEEVGALPTAMKSIRWTLLRGLDAVLLKIRAALSEEELVTPSVDVPPTRREPSVVRKPPTVAAAVAQPKKETPAVAKSPPRVIEEEEKTKEEAIADVVQRKKVAKANAEAQKAKRAAEKKLAAEQRRRKSLQKSTAESTKPTSKVSPTPRDVGPPPGLHPPLSTPSLSLPSSVDSVVEWDTDEIVTDENGMDELADMARAFEKELREEVEQRSTIGRDLPPTLDDISVELAASAVPSSTPPVSRRPISASNTDEVSKKQRKAQEMYDHQMQQNTLPALQTKHGDWDKPGDMAAEWLTRRPPPPPSPPIAPQRVSSNQFKFNPMAQPFIAKTASTPSAQPAPIGRPTNDPHVLMSFPPRSDSPPPSRGPLLDDAHRPWLSMSGGLFNLSSIWQPKLNLDSSNGTDSWAEHGFKADDGVLEGEEENDETEGSSEGDKEKPM